MARPTKKPADRKAGLIAFRATAADRRLLEQAAKAKGVQLSTFVREAALRSARAVKGANR